MKPPKIISRLIAAAVSAQKNAYCPYSRYSVGAAVLTESGRIFAGCNVENASYGLSLCAERVAIFNAVTRRQLGLRAVCVVANLAKPCGACRQVMFEFSTKDTEIYMVDLNPRTRRQKIRRTLVYKLMPDPFDPLACGLLPVHPQNLLRHRRPAKKGVRGAKAGRDR
ncbi:MAG: cytidine deaminase [Elusimicrobiota bacterium]